MAGAGVLNLDLSGFNFDFINKGKEAKAYAAAQVESSKIQSAAMVQAASERNKVLLVIGVAVVILVLAVLFFR